MNSSQQNEASHQPEFSLVILCYKAGESIKEFIARVILVLENAGVMDYELILVGNYHEGIADITPKVVAELALTNSKIMYVAKPKQGMMGWDMKTGLRLASGNFIAVIDGDGQILIEDIVKVYDKIKQGNHDLIKTYRVHRGDGIKRKVISFIFNALTQILFPGITSRDINAKPKIFTRAALEKLDLVSDDWFIDAEIMISARRQGFRIFELPTNFLGLSGRKSFIKSAAILEFLLNLAKYRIREFRHKGLRE